MPLDPFSEEETEAAVWNALKVLPPPTSFLANPQPDVPLPAPYDMNAVGGRLTQEMLNKILDEVWRGHFRGPKI